MDLAPIIVVTDHRHGKAEATRRITAAIDAARTTYAAKFRIAEEKWDGDTLTFRAALLGLPCTGTIVVGDDKVRTEVNLSWYMAHMVKPAEAFIQKQGAIVLSSS